MGAKGGPKATEVPVGDYAGIGGRALTSAIVSKEVPPLCHPLGTDNKLVIAPGLLSGTAAAISGRLSVGCKSPLTGGIKEANAGGQPSQMLARLGYAAIVLEGKPRDDTIYKRLSKKAICKKGFLCPYRLSDFLLQRIEIFSFSKRLLCNLSSQSWTIGNYSLHTSTAPS